MGRQGGQKVQRRLARLAISLTKNRCKKIRFSYCTHPSYRHPDLVSRPSPPRFPAQNLEVSSRCCQSINPLVCALDCPRTSFAVLSNGMSSRTAAFVKVSQDPKSFSGSSALTLIVPYAYMPCKQLCNLCASPDGHWGLESVREIQLLRNGPSLFVRTRPDLSPAGICFAK